jgi:energy-coupling factor transporter transmembrane protein EcfT
VPPSKAKVPASKVRFLDRLNIFIAVFGLIAVVVGLLSNIWLIAVISALSVVVTYVIIAIIEKSIKWPAWRVIIALALVSILFFVHDAAPKVESFQVNMYNFSDWPVTNPPQYDFPVTDDPETGQQYSNFELDLDNEYNIDARCWAPGHLFGKKNINVGWVSVKGGSYDGLWIPLEAVAMGSPGLANDLPNCDSWWFKLWPF